MYGEVRCPAHMDQAREAAEQRERLRIEHHQGKADASREEFERLTPGLPYPPAPTGRPLTFEERMGPETRFLVEADGEGVQVRNLVRIFNAQAPDRITTVTVQPRNGLFSPAKHAQGWAFGQGPPPTFPTTFSMTFRQLTTSNSSGW